VAAYYSGDAWLIGYHAFKLIAASMVLGRCWFRLRNFRLEAGVHCHDIVEYLACSSRRVIGVAGRRLLLLNLCVSLARLARQIHIRLPAGYLAATQIGGSILDLFWCLCLSYFLSIGAWTVVGRSCLNIVGLKDSGLGARYWVIPDTGCWRQHDSPPCTSPAGISTWDWRAAFYYFLALIKSASLLCPLTSRWFSVAPAKGSRGVSSTALLHQRSVHRS